MSPLYIDEECTNRGLCTLNGEPINDLWNIGKRFLPARRAEERICWKILETSERQVNRTTWRPHELAGDFPLYTS